MDVEQKQPENAYCVYMKNFEETRVSSKRSSSSGSATKSRTGSSNGSISGDGSSNGSKNSSNNGSSSGSRNGSNNSSRSNHGDEKSKDENGDSRGEAIENYMTSYEENKDAEEKYTNHELSEKNISAETSNLNNSFDPIQFQNEYNGNGIVPMKWGYKNDGELPNGILSSPDGTHNNMYLREYTELKGNENLTNYDMPKEIEEKQKYFYTSNEHGELLNMYGIKGKENFEIAQDDTQQMTTMFSCEENRNTYASTNSTNSNGRSTVDGSRGTQPIENVLIGRTAQSCEQGEYELNTGSSGNSGSGGSEAKGKNVEYAGNENVPVSLSNMQNEVNNGDPSTYIYDSPFNEKTVSKIENMCYYDMHDVSGNKLNDYISNMQVMRDTFKSNHLSNMGRNSFDMSADVGPMSYEAVAGMSGMNSVGNVVSPTRMNDFDHVKNLGECSELQKIMEGKIVKEMNHFTDKGNSSYINFMKRRAEDKNLNSLNCVDMDYYHKGGLYGAASDESVLLKGQTAGTNHNILRDASAMNMGNTMNVGNTMNDTHSVNSTSTLSNMNGVGSIGTVNGGSGLSGISTLNTANSISNVSSMSALSNMSALSSMSALSNMSAVSGINALSGINAMSGINTLNDTISLSNMNSLNEDGMNLHTNRIENKVSKEDLYLMTQGEASKNIAGINEDIKNGPIVYNEKFNSEGIAEKNFPYEVQTFHVAELSKKYNRKDKGNGMNIQDKTKM